MESSVRSLWRKLSIAAALLGAPMAWASPLAVAEQVQAPAWLDRDGQRRPLAPGDELRSGDQVLTGADARVYFRFAEGSVVKLGERGTLGIFSHSVNPRASLTGALDLLSGAFRFTTDAVNKLRGKRNLTIRVSTATIGIRGTDVWGKAAEDRDLVALIEGVISLSRAGEELPIVPMQYLDAPRGGLPQIKELTAETLVSMAEQTEIAASAGASRRKGKAFVTVAVAADEEAALALYDQIRNAGFSVKIRPLPQAAGSTGTAGQWRYALRLTGFADSRSADAALTRLRQQPGIKLPAT